MFFLHKATYMVQRNSLLIVKAICWIICCINATPVFASLESKQAVRNFSRALEALSKKIAPLSEEQESLADFLSKNTDFKQLPADTVKRLQPFIEVYNEAYGALVCLHKQEARRLGKHIDDVPITPILNKPEARVLGLICDRAILWVAKMSSMKIAQDIMNFCKLYEYPIDDFTSQKALALVQQKSNIMFYWDIILESKQPGDFKGFSAAHHNAIISKAKDLWFLENLYFITNGAIFTLHARIAKAQGKKITDVPMSEVLASTEYTELNKILTETSNSIVSLIDKSNRQLSNGIIGALAMFVRIFGEDLYKYTDTDFTLNNVNEFYKQKPRS